MRDCKNLLEMGYVHTLRPNPNTKTFTGWWFQIILYFHPDPWGNDPIWRAYFSGWVGSTTNYPKAKETPSMETPDPPFMTPRKGPEKNRWQLDTPWHPMTALGWVETTRVLPKNRGTPKWIVYNGKPYEKMDDLGVFTPIFGHTQLVPDFFLVFDTPFLHVTCDTQVPRGHEHKTWTCRWAGCGWTRYHGFQVVLGGGWIVVFDTRIFDKVYNSCISCRLKGW